MFSQDFLLCVIALNQLIFAIFTWINGSNQREQNRMTRQWFRDVQQQLADLRRSSNIEDQSYSGAGKDQPKGNDETKSGSLG